MPDALIIGLLVIILGNQIWLERSVAYIKGQLPGMSDAIEHLQSIVDTLRG